MDKTFVGYDSTIEIDFCKRFSLAPGNDRSRRSVRLTVPVERCAEGSCHGDIADLFETTYTLPDGKVVRRSAERGRIIVRYMCLCFMSGLSLNSLILDRLRLHLDGAKFGLHCRNANSCDERKLCRTIGSQRNYNDRRTDLINILVVKAQL